MGLSTFKAAEEPEKAIEDRQQVRRATGDIEVDGNLGRNTVTRLQSPGKGPAAQRAGTHRNHDTRRWNGRVSLEESLTHVHGDRPCHDHSICVTRRGDELNSETRQVEDHVRGRDELRFATVAAGGDSLDEASLTRRKRRTRSHPAIIYGARPLRTTRPALPEAQCFPGGESAY